MDNEEKLNLIDLFEKLHAENTVKQETMLKIEYNIKNPNPNPHLFVYADLKPTMKDASYCVSDKNGDLICFEFMFKNGSGTDDYENYIWIAKNLVNNLEGFNFITEEESIKKQIMNYITQLEEKDDIIFKLKQK